MFAMSIRKDGRIRAGECHREPWKASCLLGKPPALRPAVRAVLAEPLPQTPGILHLVRATVWREDGRLWARSAGQQGAAMMHSLARANAWAVIPGGARELPAGSEIDVRVFGDT